MGEEFQGGVCGGNWWNNSPRNLFASSPCSSAINDMGGFSVMWPNGNNLLIEMKSTRSSSNSAGSNSDDNNSVVLQEVPNTIQRDMLSYRDWNHEFINDSAKSEESYSQFLQETTSLNPGMNYVQDSSITPFNQTSQGLTSGFPLSSSSYGYTSSLLQTLFDTDSEPQSMNYSSAQNCAMINSNEFLPSLPKASSITKPKNQLNNLQFTNNTPFWNATSANTISTSFALPTQSQFLPSSNGKVNRANFTPKHHNQEPVSKKANCEPAFKRPRIETPSPLPTFKVRKEKMGDRVTALQQLVSPFGKTDTASVLHEAIEYIKFLHDKVGVLSTPYLKNGSPSMQHQQTNDQEGLKQDLRSRGLCLVPISSTYPITTETPNDFWTPAFGGSFM